MIKSLKITVLLLFLFLNMNGQEILRTDINNVINAAITESPAQLLSKTRLSNQYWQYRSFKSFFKPQLSFDATLPGLSRSIDAIPLPDGSEAFVKRSFMRTNAGIQLSQLVHQTGGTVSVTTGLNRIDLFKTSSQNGSRSYLSSPISLGFSQPILQFNQFKWTRKLSEIRYNQSKQQYIEETEEIIYDAVNFYFDLYISILNLDEAERNQVYLDSLSVNANGRFETGRISETEMLQIRLSSKNANALVNTLELDVQDKNELLRNFLGIKEDILFELENPDNVADYVISRDKALEEAQKNRSRTADFRLRILNAERDLEQAVKSGGANLSLNGSFGLTQSGNTFGSAYNNLLDEETITLTLSVPIADFGRRRAQREIAQSNLQLERLQVEQDEISFEREIIVNVEQFDLRRKQLALSEESLEIAVLRLGIAKNRYNIGKTTVTNLNIAIQEHVNARQSYYAALWSLKRAHHELRLLTLYDFQLDRTIVVE